MPRAVQLARVAVLTIAVGGVGAGGASAITLENPASFDVYEGTPGPSLSNPRALTGDLNRDGIADVLGGSGGSGLRFALGGAGGLGSAAAVPGSSGPQAAALGDLDRDGDLDLVQIQSGGLAVSFGDGNGGFGAAVPGESLTGTCHDVALGDLDRDGDLDAVAACGNQLAILRGDGAGLLSVGPYHPLGDGIEAATRVELVDGDRDGTLDAIVNDSSDGEVGLNRGAGDGTFAATVRLGPLDANADMAITDMNRDGALDLIGLPSGGSSSVRLSFARGNGYFSSSRSVAIPHGDATAVDVADLDHDGHGDLVITGRRGVLTAPLRGPTFHFQMTLQTAAWSSAMALGDVDGDGRSDVVLLDKDGDGLQVARNVTERPAPNAFQRITPEPSTNSGPAFTTSADLDRDGIPDLIVAQQTASRVGVFPGNGDGTFGDRADYWGGGSSPSQIVPADMNRDGIPDLVVGHALGGRLGVLIGNGDGGFQEPRVHEMPFLEQALGVAVGDFDRDGIPDVATANEARRVSFFRGLGDGSLAAPVQFATASGTARGLVAGDFDRDGKLDLAVISGDLNLLRGNGDGTFQAATTTRLPSGGVASAIRAADLDRDGRLDIVTANYWGPSISVLRGNGDGGFEPRTDHPTTGNPRGLDVGDVNDDRIPDVVFSDGAGSTIGVLPGNGDGTFRAVATHDVGPSTYGLAIVDLDRDGRAEIAAPSYTEQRLTVLRPIRDEQSPTTTDDVPTGWTWTGRVILSASDPEGAGVDKTYYTVGTDPEDPTTASSVYTGPLTLSHGQRVKYFSVDKAGNAEPVRTSAPIQIDETPPTTTATLATGWQNAPVEVTLTAADTEAGVSRIYYTVGTNPSQPMPWSPVYDPASKPKLTHGQRIRFRAEDQVGNVEATKAAGPVQVDTVLPTVTDDVTDDWRTGPVAVTLTPADTGGSGVATTHYEVGADPAEPTTSSPVYDPASTPLLQDGERIRYLVRDGAGNVSAVGTSAAARVDGAPPTTTDDVPSEWRTSPVEVTLDATDARSGVAATHYEIGAAPAEPTTASPVYDPASKPLLQHGERIAYRSVDVAGNLEEVRTSAAARVDAAAPDAPALLAGPPPADPATTASIAFAGEPDAAYLCAVDDGPAAPCASPLVLTDLVVGEHVVRIEQIDPAGHRSAPLVVRFAVTAPPVDPPRDQPPGEQPPSPPVEPAPLPQRMRAVLGEADGAGRRPVVLVAGQSGIACATDRGAVGACRLEARSVRRLTTASGKRLPVGTLLAVGASTSGVAVGERLATDLRLTKHGRAARATHPLGLTARLWVIGTAPGGATARGSSLIRLMTSDTLTIRVPGRPRGLPSNARLLLGRLVRTVGGEAKAVRCTADTDPSGDAAADRALTVAQARAACRYLAARGLTAKRTSVGRGSARPRASNRTDRGRALNRRLTIRITL